MSADLILLIKAANSESSESIGFSDAFIAELNLLTKFWSLETLSLRRLLPISIVVCPVFLSSMVMAATLPSLSR